MERRRGRFAEAVRILESTPPASYREEARQDLDAHLLAGDTAGAATRAIGVPWGAVGQSAPALRCLTAALRGDPTPVAPSSTVVCGLLEADREHGQGRSRVLEALGRQLASPAPPRWRDEHGQDERVTQREIASLLALETELGVDVDPARPLPAEPRPCPARAPEDPALLDHPASLFFDPALGAPGLSLRVLSALERSLPAGSPPCARRMQVAVPVAAFEALAGDATEARRVARLAVGDGDRAGPDRTRVAAFLAAVDLATGDPEKAREEIRSLPPDAPDRTLLLRLADLATGRLVTPLAEPALVDLAGDYRDGDRVADLAQRLASPLAQRPPSPLGLVRLAATRVDRGQGALREWLRWGDKWDLGGAVTNAAASARLRDIAAALGEPELAREHEAAAAAFHRALTRRETAVRLAVLPWI